MTGRKAGDVPVIAEGARITRFSYQFGVCSFSDRSTRFLLAAVATAHLHAAPELEHQGKEWLAASDSNCIAVRI